MEQCMYCVNNDFVLINILQLETMSCILMFHLFAPFQVLSRSSTEEPCGWWHAKVKMVKGDFVVVEYLGWDSTYSEIVQKDRIRPLNTK